MPQRRTAERHARWQARALRRGALARLLWPLAALYGLLVALRRRLYARGLLRTEHLSVPVIVVGNLVVGGAGKTPTVIALVQHLRARGWSPGVVARGYGRRSTEVVQVLPGTPTDDSGDEPALIQRATGVPVFVAAQRVAAARALLAAHPQVDLLLCDDGLQHLALGRDLSIAVFDERGCGNGWLLPAGLLREPWPSARGALAAPDLVLRQRREGRPVPALLAAPGIPMFDATRRLADQAWGPQGQCMPLTQLQNQTLTALAGIAQPEVFFDMLRKRGLSLAQTVALPDHAPAPAYAELLRSTSCTLVCTEKDAVKLFRLLGQQPEDASAAPPRVWSVALELTPEPGFFSAIDAHLAAAWPSGRRPEGCCG